MRWWFCHIIAILSWMLVSFIKNYILLQRISTSPFIKKITHNKWSSLTLVPIPSNGPSIMRNKTCSSYIDRVRLVVKVDLHAVSWTWINLLAMVGLNHNAGLTLLFDIRIKVAIGGTRTFDWGGVFDIILNIIDLLLDLRFKAPRTRS
jgi:hypothetical protein